MLGITDEPGVDAEIETPEDLDQLRARHCKNDCGAGTRQPAQRCPAQVHNQANTDQGKAESGARRHRNILGANAGQQEQAGNPANEREQAQRNREGCTDQRDSAKTSPFASFFSHAFSLPKHRPLSTCGRLLVNSKTHSSCLRWTNIITDVCIVTKKAVRAKLGWRKGISMIKSLIGFACAGALWLAVANGQVSTVTGAESTGKITDYTPDSALVLDTGSGEPVHYKFARNVTYVDKDGETIQAAALTKNLRVKVHYLKQGGDMIVDKVTLTE